MLEFSGAKPGDRVVDFVAGTGYFTRLFAIAVGPTGKVYTAMPNNSDGGAPGVAAIANNPAYSNVALLVIGPDMFDPPEPIDVLWTAQNYHDLHLSSFGLDVPATLKSFFDALEPGGVMIVVDHAAATGTGLEVPDRLHRINPEIVKRELTAAGFVFDGESDVLRNPDDDHTREPIDPSVRGKTDQFVLRFRKPE